MINYNSQQETQFAEFSNLCGLALDPANRWIQLGALLPWDRMVATYRRKFSPDVGAGATNPRWVIGALIIKHKLGFSDEETMQCISENPYMQFFLGLDTYRPAPLFAPTLFVELRKKLDDETFGASSETLITLTEDAESPEDQPRAAPKGKLKIDATVADQYIRFPTDLSLVNEARVKTEAIIDRLWELVGGQLPVKPRTYRKVAHKRYLRQTKKKNSSAADRRKTMRYLLNCTERNLGHIDNMLDLTGGRPFPLARKYQRQLWVISTLYGQQREMYEQKSNRCDDRIVSIAQPHVRPIVRGKAGKRMEFGSKLGLSLFGGYLTHQRISWDAYNEAAGLTGQAETYRLLTGHYPELIQCDKSLPYQRQPDVVPQARNPHDSGSQGLEEEKNEVSKAQAVPRIQRAQSHRRAHWQRQAGLVAGTDKGQASGYF